MEDIIKSKSLFNDDYTFKNKGIAFAKSNIREKICKKDGMNNMYKNCNQDYYCRNMEDYDDDIDDDYDYDNYNNNNVCYNNNIDDDDKSYSFNEYDNNMNNCDL